MPTTTKSSTIVNHAERFEHMCASLDSIRPTYKRSSVPHAQPLPPAVCREAYLVTHIKHWLYELLAAALVQGRTERCYQLQRRANGIDDGRRSLPRAIARALRTDSNANWCQEKVTVTWVVCWINSVRPDRSIQGWEVFQASHRCLTPNCLTSGHITWESPAKNQSRGHTRDVCTRVCTHCTQRLCVCQAMHSPACL